MDTKLGEVMGSKAGHCDGSEGDGFEVLQRDGFEPNNGYLSQIESIIS